MRLGFFSGTGPEGKGLSLRFAAAGASVVLGSRDLQRASRAADACNTVLGEPLILGMENRELFSACNIIFLAVPYARAVDAVVDARPFLHAGHILVDVTVPLSFRGGGVEYLEQEGGSNSEIIARQLPAGIPLVAAFKTIPAGVLARLDAQLNCDVFVCGDDAEAKRSVLEAASLIPSLRPLDAGPLRSARILERMTALAAWLNLHYKSKGARYRIEGL
ncbi:MAG: putative dinucleotide-binding enzyme [Acidobacteria bacterium]|nr:putative dinucleotide-binding enzyme [Acidobacteriota bacterium]